MFSRCFYSIDQSEGFFQGSNERNGWSGGLGLGRKGSRKGSRKKAATAASLKLRFSLVCIRVVKVRGTSIVPYVLCTSCLIVPVRQDWGTSTHVPKAC